MTTQPTIQKENLMTTQSKPTHNIRPAGMGFNCDAWDRKEEDGPLARCRCRAKFRMVLNDSTGAYTLKRCPAHAQELRDKEANGATFEIWFDEAIKAGGQ